MIHSLHKTLLTAALAAAALFPLRAADGRIPISAAPYTISAPGHYYLTRDLTLNAAGAIAINIGSGDVRLDLNGLTLAMTGTGTTYGIFINAALSNVVVRNGTLRGAVYNVYASQNSLAASNLLVEDLLILNNNASGTAISLGATTGSYQGVVVRRNLIISESRPSIDVRRANGGAITDNTIRNTAASFVGINAQDCIAFEIAHNRILGGGLGINLQMTSVATTGHDVHDNTVENAGSCISLIRAAGNQIRQNNVTGCTNAGIGLASGSDHNAITGNGLQRNATGLQILVGAGTANVYSGNRAMGSTTPYNITAAGNTDGGENY